MTVARRSKEPYRTLWRRPVRFYRSILSKILVLILAQPVFAQQAETTAAIWRDRGDVAALDLLNGPGGKEHQPGSNFTFIEESRSGTSPKFDVEDENGTTWKVKLGPEAKPETAATRLVWAAGYFADEDYYRPQIRVQGMRRLSRGQEFVSADGLVRKARLERYGIGKKLKNWSWYDNPFVGTREFDGLRMMMVLINNWDLEEINNEILDVNGESRYEVADLGASFGRTGTPFGRSKSVMKDYAESRFIEKATPEYVDFVMHSRPFFLAIFDYPNYRFRTRMESVAKHIPIANARWLGDRLGQLSPGQISDCFRAAGYSPDEVDGFAEVVEKRIAELRKL